MAQIKVSIVRRYTKPIKILVEAADAEEAFVKVNNDPVVKAQVEALFGATEYIADVESMEESIDE